MEFKRVTVVENSEVDLEFSLTKDAFDVVNENGDDVIYSGEHSILLERGTKDDTVEKFTFTL